MGCKLKQPILLSELSNILGLPFKGPDIKIDNVAALNDANQNSLVFSKSIERLSHGVTIVDVPEAMCNSADLHDTSMILSANPRFDFIRALDYLDGQPGFARYEFDAEIHPDAILGHNVVVEEGCIIGKNVILEHNVVIHKGTRIGENSRVRANSAIGGDGFGFERYPDGTPLRFPHLGGVVIGENVEIGSNTCIARGALVDTVIEDNVKIDNLVHIAHNCVIKKNAYIIACASVSGSVTVGENAWIAPNATILQKLSIGDGAFVGLAAGIVRDVEPNMVYAGNPARAVRKIEQ